MSPDTSHLVCGTGDVLGNFTNNGTVLADVANNALTLKGVDTQRLNNATMTATNGGTLRIGGQFIQGPGGVLRVDTPGSTLQLGDIGLEDVTISGGTILQVAGVSRLSNRARLSNVSIEGVLTVPGVTNECGSASVDPTINLSRSTRVLTEPRICEPPH